MQTHTMSTGFTGQTKTDSQPATPRGRALFTIDWFVNGKPVLLQHDNPNVQLNQCYSP